MKQEIFTRLRSCNILRVLLKTYDFLGLGNYYPHFKLKTCSSNVFILKATEIFLFILIYILRHNRRINDRKKRKYVVFYLEWPLKSQFDLVDKLNSACKKESKLRIV